MGFSRQKYWRGLPCPPPGELPDSGIESVGFLNVLPWQVGSWTLALPGKPHKKLSSVYYKKDLWNHLGSLPYEVIGSISLAGSEGRVPPRLLAILFYVGHTTTSKYRADILLLVSTKQTVVKSIILSYCGMIVGELLAIMWLLRIRRGTTSRTSDWTLFWRICTSDESMAAQIQVSHPLGDKRQDYKRQANSHLYSRGRSSTRDCIERVASETRTFWLMFVFQAKKESC